LPRPNDERAAAEVEEQKPEIIERVKEKKKKRKETAGSRANQEARYRNY